MHDRIVRVPDIELAAVASVLSIALSLAGYHWDGWALLPVAIRFTAGVIAFGVAPGLLIAGPFVARKRTISPVDTLISIFTCSFSCNLVFNIALFLLERPFADLAYAYLTLLAAGYIAWGLVAWSGRGRGDTEQPVWRASWDTVAVAVALAAAAGALVLIAYQNGSPPVNPEELVSLRKLAENPSVRYDNISFRNGDPSTYLFVPFQILIVGASIAGRLDVVLTYSLFWAVTTLLSIVVVTRLAYVLFGRADVTAVVCLLIVAIGVFDPRSVIYHAGIITPYPNRYGFGSGVLLPLGLLLFWSILRNPGTQAWRWALLVYLVIETTFVHARETILGMGTLVVVFMLLAVRPRQHRQELVRIAGALLLMIGVLLAYKYINLRLAPQLDTYVSGLSDASRDAAAAMVDEHGWLGALVTEGPDAVRTGVATSTIRTEIASYHDLFVRSWEDPDFTGRLFLPVVLVLLPFYAAAAASVAELSLAIVLAGLGAITASGLVELHLTALIGNPEVFVAYNIIFLAALFVLAGMACAGGQTVGRALEGARTRRLLTAGVAAAFVATLCLLADPVNAVRLWLAEAWTGEVAWVLIAATIAGAGFRLSRRDLPLFAPMAAAPSRLGLLVAACLALAVVTPAIPGSSVWNRNPFQPEYPPGRFTGNLLDDYSLLGATDKVRAVYPVEVLRFLREDVPPNRTVLSKDTLALLAVTPHFAAIVSSEGNVLPSFIVNADFLEAFSNGDGNLSINRYFLGERDRQTFKNMLRTLRVDLLVVDPTEAQEVRRSLNQHEDARTMLKEVFESEGYIVYEVDTSGTIAALGRGHGGSGG